MKAGGVLLISWATLACSGCASDKPPAKPQAAPTDRQAAALRDPFNYGPGKDFGQEKPKDVDDKGSLKEDWKRFWNP